MRHRRFHLRPRPASTGGNTSPHFTGSLRASTQRPDQGEKPALLGRLLRPPSEPLAGGGPCNLTNAEQRRPPGHSCSHFCLFCPFFFLLSCAVLARPGMLGRKSPLQTLVCIQSFPKQVVGNSLTNRIGRGGGANPELSLINNPFCCSVSSFQLRDNY